MDKAYLIAKDIIRTDLPELKPGMKVKVFEKVKEGDKERTAQFSGIVIAIKHGSKTPDATFTVRTVLDGVGVEKTWPLHSPNIEKIEILDTLRVRRAKLYYIRNLTPKKLRKKLRSLKEFIGSKKDVKDIEKEVRLTEKEQAEESVSIGKEEKEQDKSQTSSSEEKSQEEVSSKEKVAEAEEKNEPGVQQDSQDIREVKNKEAQEKEVKEEDKKGEGRDSSGEESLEEKKTSEEK